MKRVGSRELAAGEGRALTGSPEPMRSAAIEDMAIHLTPACLLVATGCSASFEHDQHLRPCVLIMNEIVAAGTPDWFEVVNVSEGPVDLADHVYVDHADDFARAVRFAELELAPAARHVQEVTDDANGFALGTSDGPWIYRSDSRALCDE